jgi:hypothetical protein
LSSKPGIAEHRLAGIGQRQPTPGLAEDRRARLFLQLLQLRADRRGRTPEPFGRLGEIAELHTGRKGSKHIEIKDGPPHHTVHIFRIICP